MPFCGTTVYVKNLRYFVLYNVSYEIKIFLHSIVIHCKTLNGKIWTNMISAIFNVFIKRENLSWYLIDMFIPQFFLHCHVLLLKSNNFIFKTLQDGTQWRTIYYVT